MILRHLLAGRRINVFSGSPAAHVQKNIATIIGSNVEVNIDVPSEFSISSRENRTVEDQEQKIVLEIKSNVETRSPDSGQEGTLTQLLAQVAGIEQNEHEVTNNGAEDSAGSEVRAEEKWKQYAKKRDYWKKFKAQKTDVSKKYGWLAILEYIVKIGNYAIDIINNIATNNYPALAKTILEIIEYVINIIVNRN